MARKKKLPEDVAARAAQRAKRLRPIAPKALTHKEQRFTEEYCVDFNATQAAIRSGYSKRSAAETGYQLLRKPQIAAAIQAFMRDARQHVEITREELIAGLEKQRRANILDYFRIAPNGEPMVDLSMITRDQAEALTEIQVDDYVDGRGEDARDVRKVRIKIADKQTAAMHIAKLLGHVVDQQKVQVEAPSIAAIRGITDLALAKDVLAQLKGLEARVVAVLKPPKGDA